MNKKILVVLAVVVVSVIIILSISDFPPTEDSKATGTIGKVEKYRDASVQGKDIELRTDFIEDEAKLKSALSSFIQYFAVTNKLENILSNIEYDKLCSSLDGEDKNLCQKLKDLNTFVTNNNDKLENTINTMIGAYQNENPPTGDIENQVIAFADYHMNLVDRNDVINEAISAIDKVLIAKPNIENKQQLIELRDFLLYTNYDLALKLADKENAKFLTKKDFIEPDKYLFKKDGRVIFKLEVEKPEYLSGLDDIFVSPSSFASVNKEKEKFGAYSFDKLGSFWSNDKLNVILVGSNLLSLDPVNLEPWGPYGSEIKLTLGISTYDPNSANQMQQVVFSEDDLNSVMVSEKLNSVMAEDKLNVYLSTGGLNVYLADSKDLDIIVIFGLPNSLGQSWGAADKLEGIKLKQLPVFMSYNSMVNIFGAYSFSGKDLQSLNQIVWNADGDLNLVNSNGELNVYAQEQLGWFSQEQLGWFSQEQLGWFGIEKLGLLVY